MHNVTAPSAKTLNIIGCGKVGRTLGRLWADAGVFSINDVLNRSLPSAEAAVKFMGAGKAVEDLRTMSPAETYLIATPDAAILPCSEALAESGLLGGGEIVFHCSGALASREMTAVQKLGVRVASIHPVKTFTDPMLDIETFAGTYCGAEGDVEALGVLSPAFERIGGRVFSIDPGNKTLYHAASVIVCNYLTALMEWGIQTYAKAGVPRETATEIIKPIVRQTVENIFQLGTVRALTGPIARGDGEVVSRQLVAIQQWNKDYGELYRLLGSIALELSRLQGNASSDNLATLAKILRRDKKS